jgi:hypothetical protein
MFERSSRLGAALLAALSITTPAHAAGPDSRAEAVNARPFAEKAGDVAPSTAFADVNF